MGVVAMVIVYILLAILFILIVVNLALILLLYSKIANIRQNQAVFNKKFANETVEDLLMKSFQRQADLGRDVAKYKNDVFILQEKQRKNFDSVKLVRYSASDDNDAKLSFSLGLTNESNDGIVLTGLYFRNGVNLYVKHINEGVPDMELSEEEQKVIIRK